MLVIKLLVNIFCPLVMCSVENDIGAGVRDVGGSLVLGPNRLGIHEIVTIVLVWK